jgi:hypothetical protein
MSVAFTLNGKAITLDADPDMPLLWALREVAGLHGTKYGCGIAQCGACTVHIESQATRSCITPLSAVAGQHVTTIEGIGSKAAKAVQAVYRLFAECIWDPERQRGRSDPPVGKARQCTDPRGVEPSSAQARLGLVPLPVGTSYKRSRHNQRGCPTE